MNNDIAKFIAQRLCFTASQVYPGLYQASKIRAKDDVKFVKALGIKSVIDLEGDLDPEMRFLGTYLFWPIHDIPVLPDLKLLLTVSTFIITELGRGHKVLVHCSQGLNRAGLVCARVITLYGVPGKEAIAQIREQRPGSLWNPVFSAYIEKL